VALMNTQSKTWGVTEVGKYYLAEPRDKNRVSLVCFTFDYLCSQELASSYLAVLTFITKFCGY
jgi:hypothetical protein